MAKPKTKEEALAQLASLCAKAEHCAYEMEEKMWKWGFDDDDREWVVAELKKAKYIDEGRYARLFVEDKVRFNKWGRRKIEQALYMKRIPRDIAEDALDAVSTDEYVEILRPLLKQKRRSVKAETDYEMRTKLMRFAAQRGFTMDVICRCVDGADEMEDE